MNAMLATVGGFLENVLGAELCECWEEFDLEVKLVAGIMGPSLQLELETLPNSSVCTMD